VAALATMLEPARIIGCSRKIRGVVQTIENIRASSASVLITGEPGTGKRLVASTIHGARLVTFESQNHVPLCGEPAFAQMNRLMDEFVRGDPSEGPTLLGDRVPTPPGSQS